MKFEINLPEELGTWITEIINEEKITPTQIFVGAFWPCSMGLITELQYKYTRRTRKEFLKKVSAQWDEVCSSDPKREVAKVKQKG